MLRKLTSLTFSKEKYLKEQKETNTYECLSHQEDAFAIIISAPFAAVSRIVI